MPLFSWIQINNNLSPFPMLCWESIKGIDIIVSKRTFYWLKRKRRGGKEGDADRISRDTTTRFYPNGDEERALVSLSLLPWNLRVSMAYQYPVLFLEPRPLLCILVLLLRSKCYTKLNFFSPLIVYLIQIRSAFFLFFYTSGKFILFSFLLLFS